MKKLLLLVFLVASVSKIYAQDDLDKVLNGLESNKTSVEYIKAAFKSTRVINLQSLEQKAPGALDLRISHRFGPISSGGYNLYGLDYATMRIGFEYGVNKFISAGFGRSTYQKTIDAHTKVSLLRQRKGTVTFADNPNFKLVLPSFSLLYYGNVSMNGLKFADTLRPNYFYSRLTFVNQLIIGRKVSESFSFQISPTLVHRNLVPTEADNNNLFAIGTAGRLKMTKRLALTGEYIYRIPPRTKTNLFTDYTNSLSVGLDIETGGHVFQLQLSNSLPMFDSGFITETNDKWLKKGIHFGFSITRDFTAKRNK
jgi:hypothetical protein